MIHKTMRKIILGIYSVLYNIKYLFINRFSNKKINKNLEISQVIITLTSFPGRIDKIYLTIESLFQQISSDFDYSIVLYLAESQFKDKKIPSTLNRLVDRGLNIVYLSEDFKSYKKLHYALQQFKNKKILTVDDDVYYPNWMLSKIFHESLKKPENIMFYRGVKIDHYSDGTLKKYIDFPLVDNSKPSLLYIPTGVSGILYPPNCFYKDVIDSTLFLKLAPRADDLWYKTMAYLNNTKSSLVLDKSIHFVPVLSTQNVGLRNTNLSNDGLNNDQQLSNLIDYYSLDFLKKDELECLKTS